MTDQARQIAKMIAGMAGKYSTHEIFADWIRCCAWAISNSCQLFHDDIWKQREGEYAATMNRYSEREQIMFAEMLAYLSESLEEEIGDALGEIYMSAEMGSRIGGQFFTPFHLSELVARMAAGENQDDIGSIQEPSCGSGGMIIAVAKIAKEKGINYQTRMKVVAQDLDWRCVHMCYVQLSLLGIKAIVVQGDTLQAPYGLGSTDPSHVLYTPAQRGVRI